MTRAAGLGGSLEAISRTGGSGLGAAVDGSTLGRRDYAATSIRSYVQIVDAFRQYTGVRLDRITLLPAWVGDMMRVRWTHCALDGGRGMA